jgi:hypothetical protein
MPPSRHERKELVKRLPEQALVRQHPYLISGCRTTVFLPPNHKITEPATWLQRVCNPV